MWQCIPEPLSPKRGFGIKVAVLPCRLAVFLTMYLNFIIESAIWLIVVYLIPISHWPPLPTSWWWSSASTPQSRRLVSICERTS